MKLTHDVGADRPGGTALCAVVGADGDQHLHVALIELAGQQLGGVRRLRGRILEAARRQAVRHRDAEHRRADHDQAARSR